MDNLLQFGALMASMIGIFVTLLLMLLKIVKNLATKEDVKNNTEALRSEMNERFEEVNRRFEEVNRRFEEVNKRFEEAAADRETIRTEMKEGLSVASIERKRIEEQACEERKRIEEQACEERKRIEEQACEERKRIEEQAREDSKEIKREINRQNQNYIEHLAYHGVPRANPVNEAEDRSR